MFLLKSKGTVCDILYTYFLLLKSNGIVYDLLFYIYVSYSIQMVQYVTCDTDMFFTQVKCYSICHIIQICVLLKSNGTDMWHIIQILFYSSQMVQ